MDESECRIIDWIMRIEEWYDTLTPQGKRAADRWLDTGAVAPILPFLSKPLARYFQRCASVVTPDRRESSFGVFVHRPAITGFV